MPATPPPAGPISPPRVVTPGRVAGVAGVAVWAATLLGVLKLRHAPGLGDQYYCGVWGCGASTGALSAVHAAWAVVLVPAAVLRARRVPRRLAVRLGIAACAAGLLAAALYTAWDVWAWLAPPTAMKRRFVWHRVGFTLLNQTDVPLLPLALAGLAVAGAAVTRRSASTTPDRKAGDL